LFITMCILSAWCTLLSSVSLYIHLRRRNRRPFRMSPEQSVPLTVGAEWTQN
jgi:hypothetical protein